MQPAAPPAAARVAALPPVLALAAIALVAALGGGALAAPLPTTAPSPGLREYTPGVVALTNARLVLAPGRIVERGTLVVRDGVIVAAGANARIPDDAVVRDLAGKTIYAGLIDAFTEMGMPKAEERPAGFGDGPLRPRSAAAPKTVSSYWNANVTPELRAADEYAPDSAGLRQLRDQGVATALVAPARGVIKGVSAVVALTDRAENRALIRPDYALHVNPSFALGFGGGGYPSSPMGAYTLVRQAFSDADWYARAQSAWQKEKSLPRPELNEGLAALAGYSAGTKRVVIDADGWQSVLRAQRLRDELDLDVIVRGSGREYQRVDEVKGTGLSLLVPVNFPRAPSVETPEQELSVELEDLMHWDLAPENPARLARAGVTFALTSDGLRDKKDFLKNVRTAIDRGLDRDAALAAVTVTPAKLLGVDTRLGTLDAGKIASFVVVEGDLFDKKGRVLETWVEGRRFDVQKIPPFDPRGLWRGMIASGSRPESLTVRIDGELDKLSGAVVPSGGRKDVNLKSASLLGQQLAVVYEADSLGGKGIVRAGGTIVGDELIGEGEYADGRSFSWTAQRSPLPEKKDEAKRSDKQTAQALAPLGKPFGVFGRSQEPEQPAVLAFRGATVWTGEKQGTIENANVVVRRGKIEAVGQNVRIPSGATVIDATGKHLTAGLIDCHSHSATDGGVNEGGQTISAEVRIGDFVNADDIDIYRELAGGLTAAHVLHGSANAIGGQSQLVKLRWGAGPEEMKFAGAPPTIKFALGENPKQANGIVGSSRYPQTRMGVEQLIRDEFNAARDYQARWAAWERSKSGIPPRRDLELEAVAEILDGKRTIHCHSYRQDEILALMRLCEEFDIRVGTFQHILEGYKVADEMKRHGAGGSSFSDWWAYKLEVQDAIPYNGALMHEAGVVVSFNSDSDELARRLNWEAAKAVKYGGVSPEAALNFVTLNPAKQLHVDDRVGSIAPGKDADLVLWSGSPLSTASRCEQTWIDGRRYFDREEDQRLRAEVTAKRAALVQKILAGGDSGKEGSASGSSWRKPAENEDYECAHAHGEEGR